jgi:hypothetical protein
LADILEHRATVLGRFPIRGSASCASDLEQPFRRDDGDQRAEGDRRVGRAEGGEADLRLALAEHVGGDARP